MKHLIVGGLVVVGFCAAFFAGRSSVSQTEAEAKPSGGGLEGAMDAVEGFPGVEIGTDVQVSRLSLGFG